MCSFKKNVVYKITVLKVVVAISLQPDCLWGPACLGKIARVLENLSHGPMMAV